MSSPSVLHQSICGELHVQLFSYFRQQPCRVFLSPLDVKLSEQDVVQPDLMVVCRAETIRQGFIDDAPDLVIENRFPFDDSP